MIAMILANVHRGKRRAYRITDFMPHYKERKQPLPKTDEELWSKINATMQMIRNGS